MEFKTFNFSEAIQEGLDAMGFEKATPIQELSIPVIMDGKDLIGIAQTGTGKTAAFILPLLEKISTDKSRKGVQAIILSPTRELAMQIDQAFQGFSYFADVSSIAVYGGGDDIKYIAQKRALESGTDVLIATPGRLYSFLATGALKTDQLRFLILDEADRMLDMGFYDDIMAIMSFLPEKRQTLLFSATMPPKIRDIARKCLQTPEQVNIGISKPAEGVIQAAYSVYEKQKTDLLIHLLKDKKLPSVLVFASTKSSVKTLVSTLKKEGLKVLGMHSDLEQAEREDNLRAFANREIPLLIATDIVSRGIDIEDINLVINYDVPQDAEDYVHRVGRTARAENTGLALTFISEKDQWSFQKIEKLIEMAVRKLNLPQELGAGPEYPMKSKKKGKKKFHHKKGGSHHRKPPGSKKSS